MKKAVFILLLVILLLVFAGKLFAQTGSCVSGNCSTGNGKMVYTDGSVYEGSFAEGRRQGEGTLIANEFVYTGHWKEGDYSGKGKLKKRPTKDSPFYEQFDCTFYAGGVTGPGRYALFFGGDTSMVYTGNFSNGKYSGRGNLHIIGICTLYSDNWTDSENFTSGKFVEEKTGTTLYGSYVANAFQKNENNGVTANGASSGGSFKRFYFEKANSTILRQNLMVTELVSTLSSAKTGSITINSKDNSIKIVTDGDGDRIYTIKNIGEETTDQYSNKKVSISCTDVDGLVCTLAIRREYAYTSDNHMLITITYANGTGKGYTCNYEQNLFNN